ncbi:hypothetical protein DdX_16030 [Ditylenchus destructor]|uniref:Uncharacterized protein n=1 Tax=Ditylenchus destructor TaxID=166010 RepID=A0AAD4MR45_9BILA|nr:hypothetical protein DdX_16030 [Ditylenchus destructor]
MVPNPKLILEMHLKQKLFEIKYAINIPTILKVLRADLNSGNLIFGGCPLQRYAHPGEDAHPGMLNSWTGR